MAEPTVKRSVIINWHPSDDNAHQWIVCDENGKAITSAQTGPLTVIAAAVNNDEVTVLVPGAEVLLTSLSLPKVKPNKLAQLLPFAMEEHLVSPVHELHLCPARAREGTQLDVAVVNKQKMNDWIASCKSAGLRLSHMVPLTLALPYQESSWHVFSCYNQSVVRTGKFQGFVTSDSNLLLFLSTKLEESSNNSPSEIIMHQFGDKKVDIASLKIPVSYQQHPPSDYSNFLQNPIDTAVAIDLLQGEFQLSQKKTPVQKLWSVAAGVLIAGLMILFGNLVAEYFYLNKKNSAVENQIATVYKKYFPSAANVVSPKFRLENQLKLLNSGGDNRYLQLVAMSGDVIKKFNTVTIKSINFRDQALSLSVAVTDFDTLRQLVEALQKNSLQVTQQDAASGGDQVKAILLIKGINS